MVFNNESISLITVLILLAGTFLFIFSLPFCYSLVTNYLSRKNMIWQGVVVKAFYMPFICFILYYSIFFCINSAAHVLQWNKFLSIIISLKKIGVIAIGVWFLIRFINLSEHYFMTKEYDKKINKTTVLIFTKLGRTTAILLAVLIFFQIYGVDISGVLAFGGLTGAAIAFSAKDLLTNFFGGIIIYMDKPFVVGDWITSPDRSIEGTVEYIGWRLCKIRNFEQRPLYIPNSLLTSIVIENASRMTHRRINTNIKIRIDDAEKLPTIVQQMKCVLQEHSEIDTTQTIIVNLIKIEASSLDLMVYAYTKTTDWVKFQNIQQDILLAFLNVIRENGAKCGVPVLSINTQLQDLFK